MAMVKRVLFFVAVNIAVMLTVGFIINILGLDAYLGVGNQGLLAFCLIWGMAGSFISLLISKFMAKKMMGVQVIDPQTRDPQLRQLVERVHALARKAQLPKMPEVGIYNSPEINAFATGPGKSSSLVAVSSGLLQRMNDSEVEGVLAHEVAHIANGDMVTLTLIQGVVNSFVMFFAYIVANAISRSDDRDGRSSYFMEFMIRQALMMVFGILAAPIVMGFSRWREFRADAGGAKFAGKEKMIGALRALQGTETAVDTNQTQFSSFKISGRRGGTLARLFMSHPPLEERIQTLERARVL